MHPLCRFCLQRDDPVEADVVDHIIPHKGDVTLFFDPNNLQSLCKTCHDRDKKLIEQGKTILHFGKDGWPIDE